MRSILLSQISMNSLLAITSVTLEMCSMERCGTISAGSICECRLRRHGAPSWRYVCSTRCSRGQQGSARPGPKHFLTRFLCARTKNMPPWTQSSMPRCEHEISLVDQPRGLYNSMPQMGAGGHDRPLVFPLAGHMSFNPTPTLRDAGLIRVMSGFLRAHSGATAVQDDAVGKPPHGGNRANRLTPLILLLLCIREHRWLALHSRVVAFES